MATKKEKSIETASLSLDMDLKFNRITIPVVGVAPLIMSRFDEKCQQEIAESTEIKQGNKKKKIADPQEQYEKSINYFADGKTYGMPAVAFKAAMVRAGQVVYQLQMVRTRTLFRVLADDAETGLVKIDGIPRLRSDMVRVGNIQKVASPRYRAEFPEWKANITIEYVADAFKEKEIVALLNAAGFCCGVGEWRPEKCNSGSFGLFKVER